ncbi:MAG TPA: prolyl oligopeptidase family serine peptidase [Actinomycetes bacterium]|nr:prolyl oligopeptidase family serine peptidase [Actinomycetes bacterium]
MRHLPDQPDEPGRPAPGRPGRGRPSRARTGAAGEPRWKRRFRAASVTLPAWAPGRPERLVAASNLSGAWQLHLWDRAAGTRRQATEHPTGAVAGALTPDGEHLCWFADDRGDEIGSWLLQPFAGGPDRPMVTDVPPAWSGGLALGPDGRVALGLASRDGFAVRAGTIGGATRELYRHEQTAGVAGLSRDGRVVFVEHAEHGDNLHPALRAFDHGDGRVIADLWDGEGNGLYVADVSPVPGDGRIAVLRELTGRLRPAVWDPAAGAVADVAADLPGEVEVAGWWPDADALLLVHNHLGRDELYRADLGSGELRRLPHPPGSVGGAGVRPDGEVWYRWSSGAVPPVIRALGRDEPVLALPGEPAPPGVAYQSWTFANERGQQVHGFVVEPDAPRPHATVMLVHGGPHGQDADAFSPQVQALVDHGFAVGLVNYRGSTGYGKAWQDALEGDPGRPEVHDVAAGRGSLVASGIADPARVMIAGASWGGYVTLQAIGTVPDGWRAAAAVVPVADYPAAYEDESEGLQALDRSLFGGSPAEVPELYRERSPITHAARVRAPVLLMVGENDTRCPLRQVLNYAERLRELGKELELDRFDAGHGALVTDERVRQTEVLLAFAARHVPGVVAPDLSGGFTRR